MKESAVKKVRLNKQGKQKRRTFKFKEMQNYFTTYPQASTQEAFFLFSSNALEKNGISEKKCVNSYSFGYQGSEKDDEIKGKGNSYTTYFRQLDPRIGRWLSVDPKYNAQESPYCSMGNNPILNNDILGDTIRTNKSGYEAFNKAMEKTLGGQQSPFSYDEKNQKIDFDESFDRSKFDEKQLTMIDGLANPAQSAQDANFKMVSRSSPIEFADGTVTTLENLGVTGLTATYYTEDGQSVHHMDIFVATDPTKYVNYNGTEHLMPAPPSTVSISIIHEIGGHSNLRLKKPLLNISTHNRLVEDYETNARQIYIVKTHTEKTAKKANKKNKGGTQVKPGDPIYLGGVAQEH